MATSSGLPSSRMHLTTRRVTIREFAGGRYAVTRCPGRGEHHGDVERPGQVAGGAAISARQPSVAGGTPGDSRCAGRGVDL